jgi:hypothetical protein
MGTRRRDGGFHLHRHAEKQRRLYDYNQSQEPAMNDRRRGVLICLAVGDALGAAVEFSSPGSFAPVTGYRSGGPY